MRLPNELKRRAIGVAAVAGIALAIVCIRVAWSGGQEHSLGLAALESGDREAAIEHLSRSARWYLPGSSRVREALERLMEAGRAAEKDRDAAGSLAAYREVRRCIRAVRSLWVPNADLQPGADERIAHLMAGQHTVNRAGEEASFDARKAEHLALLARDDAPDPFWSLLVVLAFLTWVGGGFGFIYAAWDSDGGFHKGPALRWAGVIVVCFAIWIVAMGQA
jgi:hypothetical protein